MKRNMKRKIYNEIREFIQCLYGCIFLVFLLGWILVEKLGLIEYFPQYYWILGITGFLTIGKLIYMDKKKLVKWLKSERG